MREFRDEVYLRWKIFIEDVYEMSRAVGDEVMLEIFRGTIKKGRLRGFINNFFDLDVFEM